jgi:glycosyltransferase involved in cell wall biosynthesis
LRARRRLRELLRQTHFDLVICHMPWSLVVFGDTVRGAGQTLGFWAHSLHTGHGWLERFARRVKPDLAIGNSRYTEAGLANLFPDVPRGVIYPPVELAAARQTERWRSTMRAQHGVAAETVVIIQVSRLEAWKGHLLHFRALSLLKDLEGWTCWIAGGPQKPADEAYLRILKKEAKELGIADRVRFLGHRSDVPQLLAAADIFCQPNLKPEPFGIVYIESLWADRPVVTTDMGGAAEIIDSSCGLLVEAENPAALAEALQRLIESPELRGRLGKAGATRARQLCEPTAQMKKLRDLTQTVMTGGERIATS